MFERRTETDGFVCRIAASFNKALHLTANPPAWAGSIAAGELGRSLLKMP